jgi:hypothetical protein
VESVEACKIKRASRQTGSVTTNLIVFFLVMLVLALASPKFLGDGLLAALAFVRQRELYPPVEAVLSGPSGLVLLL